MNASIRTTLLSAVLAVSALGASAAQAQQPGIAYGEPYGSQRDDGYRRDRDRDDRRDDRRDCRAHRWDPEARYMPGQMVRHQGRFYVATRLSARVYNVNSPPAWTPNYWVRARCM